VDREVKDMFTDNEDFVTVMDWWEILGLDRDMTVEEIRKMGILDKDGVHLNTRACRCAAVSLCDRFLWESDPAGDEKAQSKQRRLEDKMEI
jgi:hypothetical protein